jgi:hypothetical protein
VTTPLDAFDRIRATDRKVWTKRRICIHGDLNATNIALDESDADRPKAYIFDAAGVHSDLACRDLAVLEVTTLLFLADSAIDQHFHVFRPFYGQDGFNPPAIDLSALPPVVRNSIGFIGAIRAAVVNTSDTEIYPLLVFDAVLIQLGGLVIQQAHNKAARPTHVRLLTQWVAEWVDLSPLLGPAAPESKRN